VNGAKPTVAILKLTGPLRKEKFPDSSAAEHMRLVLLLKPPACSWSTGASSHIQQSSFFDYIERS